MWKWKFDLKVTTFNKVGPFWLSLILCIRFQNSSIVYICERYIDSIYLNFGKSKNKSGIFGSYLYRISARLHWLSYFIYFHKTIQYSSNLEYLKDISKRFVIY